MPIPEELRAGEAGAPGIANIEQALQWQKQSPVCTTLECQMHLFDKIDGVTSISTIRQLQRMPWRRKESWTSSRRRDELRQPHQVVGGGRESKGPPDRSRPPNFVFLPGYTSRRDFSRGVELMATPSAHQLYLEGLMALAAQHGNDYALLTAATTMAKLFSMASMAMYRLSDPPLFLPPEPPPPKRAND